MSFFIVESAARLPYQLLIAELVAANGLVVKDFLAYKFSAIAGAFGRVRSFNAKVSSVRWR
jgi:hypothetical protein